VDARIITVSGATGSTTASVVIMPINGSYGVGKLRIGNSGGELVDMNITVLGIDTTLVAGMIGIASSDIGTLCRGLVGTVQKINKWSKHKPIRYASMQPLDDTIWKNQSYGLAIQSIGGDAIKAHAISAGFDVEDLSTQIKWTYLYPTGGASQPFRLDDFRGYDGASIPLFDPQRVANLDIHADGYGKLIWMLDISTIQDQSWGGLVPSDFQAGPNWHLGVMLIDYEAEGYPIRILAIDTATIDTTQFLELDITNLPSSTYLACFFLQYSASGGFDGQLNNPTSMQLSALDDYDSWTAIEDGIVAVGITTFYAFFMWQAHKYGEMQQIALAASDYYNYFPGSYLPSLDTTNGRLQWTNFAASFSIAPKVAFDPAYGIIWKLNMPIYLWDPSIWVDNTWRRIVGWRDPDNYEVSLMVKTVQSGSSYVLWLAFWDDDSDTMIGSAYQTPYFLPVSTYTPGENIPQPLMLELSNYNNDVKIMTVKAGESVMTNNAVNPIENPPSLTFGASTEKSAPRGLAMEYIDFEAAGRESI
jgi:hypothetical protein